MENKKDAYFQKKKKDTQWMATGTHVHDFWLDFRFLAIKLKHPSYTHVLTLIKKRFLI